MNVRKAFGQSVAVVALCVLSAASAGAQVSKDAPVPPVRGDDPPAAPGERAAIDNDDRQMMETMARAGIAEVQAGEIAQRNASSPEVKSFARTMVQDHGKANDELEALAAEKGVKLPTEPDAPRRELIEESKQKTGPAFDRLYVSEAALQEHLEAKKLFEEASKSATDPDLRAFAQKTLPVIEHHHQMAETLSRSVSEPAGG